MARRRRGSMPAPSSTGDAASALITPPSNSSSGKQPLGPLLPRAEALAKMTFELNIRRLEAQVNDLQKDMAAVVRATADDAEFRTRNETRLSKIWEEMTAVQQQADRVDSSQEQSRIDLDTCQRETQDMIGELRSEIGSLRGLIDGISRQMDRFSTEELPDSGYSSLPIRRAMTTSQDISQGSGVSDRIDEAIKSTQRWNRDHKTTKLSDAAFCANYLRQQSKRDAALAVRIQRSIGRRVRRRSKRSYSRPSTLDEFCRDVAWQDVLDTVQEVLLDKRKATLAELGGGAWK